MRNGITGLRAYQQGGPVLDKLRSLWEGIRGRADDPSLGYIGASMLPGIGEATDLVEIGAGLQDRSLGRVGLGLAGLALPFVGAAGLRKLLKGRRKLPIVRRPQLPMDEASRMARAKEMEFDLDVYHGTPEEIKGPFRVSPHEPYLGWGKIGSGVYVTPNPKVAERYTTDARSLKYPGEQDIKTGSMYPLKVRSKKLLSSDSPEWKELLNDVIHNDPFFSPTTSRTGPYFKPGGWGYTEASERARILAAKRGWEGFYHPQEIIQKVRRGEGLESVILPDAKDASEIVIFDPKNLRSRWAAFDPKKRHVADLLAGIGGLAGAGYMSNALREDNEY